jgi:hypothetical protein
MMVVTAAAAAAAGIDAKDGRANLGCKDLQ